jgi:hypothetical protein
VAVNPTLLRNALAPTRRPYTPAQAERVFGGGAKGRSELAMALAGTTDKSSRAYKSARRNLERYAAAEGKQRRAMGDKLRPKINTAAQTRQAAAKLTGPIRVMWENPEIQVSSDRRQRPDLPAEISADRVAEIRELLEAGDERGATDLLVAASMADYMGSDRADMLMLDAEGLTISTLN